VTRGRGLKRTRTQLHQWRARRRRRGRRREENRRTKTEGDASTQHECRPHEPAHAGRGATPSLGTGAVVAACAFGLHLSSGRRNHGGVSWATQKRPSRKPWPRPVLVGWGPVGQEAGLLLSAVARSGSCASTALRAPSGSGLVTDPSGVECALTVHRLLVGWYPVPTGAAPSCFVLPDTCVFAVFGAAVSRSRVAVRATSDDVSGTQKQILEAVETAKEKVGVPPLLWGTRRPPYPRES
jgi:hypothetical protein